MSELRRPKALWFKPSQSGFFGQTDPADHAGRRALSDVCVQRSVVFADQRRGIFCSGDLHMTEIQPGHSWTRARAHRKSTVRLCPYRVSRLLT